MEEFKKVVDELQRSMKSLQDQMTSLKSGEVPSGAKTPGERSSPVQQVGDKVPTWAERMELETEAGDEIRPVKVREETELVLQKAFVPLKNQDRRALKRQFLVPDMPLTMAPKLDKVLSTPASVDVGRGGPPHRPAGKNQQVCSLRGTRG